LGNVLAIVHDSKHLISEMAAHKQSRKLIFKLRCYTYNFILTATAQLKQKARREKAATR